MLSSLFGVPLGILCGTYRFFSRLQEPFIEFFRYLPAPAFGALCVAILGIDDGPKIAIIFIGTFFQQVLVIANTVRKVDPALIEAAQTLGAHGWKLVRRVIIPASITDIYTDMRILLGWAWTYLIVAEVVGTMSGITFFINQQARYRNFDNVFAAIGMIGIIGLTTDLFLAWLGTVLFPWKRPGAETRPIASPWRARDDRRVSAVEPKPAECRARPPVAPAAPPSPLNLSHVATLDLPDYRKQDPAVAARFQKIQSRPVVLNVDSLKKAFGPAEHSTSFSIMSRLDIHRREFITVIGP